MNWLSLSGEKLKKIVKMVFLEKLYLINIWLALSVRISYQIG